MSGKKQLLTPEAVVELLNDPDSVGRAQPLAVAAECIQRLNRELAEARGRAESAIRGYNAVKGEKNLEAPPSKHAELLETLDHMRKSLAYAVRRDVIAQARAVIIDFERVEHLQTTTIAFLTRELREKKAQHAEALGWIEDARRKMTSMRVSLEETLNKVAAAAIDLYLENLDKHGQTREKAKANALRDIAEARIAVPNFERTAQEIREEHDRYHETGMCYGDTHIGFLRELMRAERREAAALKGKRS